MQIIQLNLATHWWSQKQLKRMLGITLLSLQTLLTRCRRDIPLPCLWMVRGIQRYLSFMCRCGFLLFLGLNSSQSYKDVSWGGGQEESTWTWALGGQRQPLSWFQDVLVKRLQAPGVVVVMIFCVFFVFCILFLCLCILLFSCLPYWLCCQSPPPPCSILALSHLTHPSCPRPAVPPLLLCLLQPSSSSSFSLLPRKQPNTRALKIGLGKGSQATWSGE